MKHPYSESPTSGLLTNPLAIVGMACRLPGADGLDEFWRLLKSGGYAIERMSDAKLNRDLYFDPAKGRRGKTYSEIGGFISEREVDWSVLPMEKAEARDWDPCHLILCEVAATACRDAGWDPRNLPLRKGAVFVGHSGGTTLGGESAYRVLLPEYVDLLRQVPEIASVVKDFAALESTLLQRMQTGRPTRTTTGRPLVETGFASAIISRTLGLSGPHMSIDAACASSLVALALGAASLQTGQSDFAIVGGASYNKSDSLILFSQAQSCSSIGSRPFDEAADGLISSEGYVAIVLKTLERAIADGDRVHAVVRGIGISSDGRGKSLWAPRKEGQYTAIKRAYSGDVTPDSISMIEAHATSTQVGDATEMEALAQFFGEHCQPNQRIPVGSVKSNIGHTLETAGLAGLVKAVLSIQHATIPPSVNVKNLNRSIPWDNIPLYVSTQCANWPKLADNVPRRAAINAFGIGGLNVHVVVEQFLEEPAKPTLANASRNSKSYCSPTFSSIQSTAHDQPIAVIGRGLVVPGAASVEQFRELLFSRENQIGPPPPGRFGYANNTSISSDCSARRPMVGGFVRGFEYDWRKHKVPPKQIAQANPLQFMLLEAAEQALRESKCLEREFDRQNTAVIVGSIFGGDFGNALFSGLRLPEFKYHLRQQLIASGITAQVAHEMSEAFEAKFLSVCPALLDETGSFTSSTLASRLSKTFDLMGGAMAIDSGDVSSFAALQAASQLLASGAVNQVLCAAAHRALDTAAMDTLARLGRLPGTGDSNEDGYFVGEGVAVVMLKRLCDAQRDGDKVLAVIEGIAPSSDATSLKNSIAIATKRLGISETDISRIVGGIGIRSLDSDVERGIAATVQQPSASAGKATAALFAHSQSAQLIGHLQAAQGLTELIAVTLDEANPQPQKSVVLASHTLSGQSYVVAIRVGERITTAKPNPVQVAASIPDHKMNSGPSRIWRFAADSLVALQQQIVRCSQTTAVQFSDGLLSRFNHEHTWRAAVVCDVEAIPAKLKLLAAQIGNESAKLPLSEQGIFWTSPDQRAHRVAWLFPGQGSQYHGMLNSLVANDPSASQALSVANAVLTKHGHPTFEELAWSQSEALGENVWHTQAAVLVADWIMLECLRSHGHQPTLVSGHSYGEFAAMLAAGCWDFEGALLATWHRCQAIVKNVPSGCSMLSIHAEQDKVRQIIRDEQLPLFISHINAPEQIVVGGKQAAIANLSELLDNEGIGTRILAVPTAFHTPALQPAQAAFRRGLASVTIHPPQLPLLSSVTIRFEAEPETLVHNLVNQLVQPVNFVALCQRLLQDQVDLVLEVGPQQVLTRLVRQNVGNNIHVMATDHSKRGAEFQILCAIVNLELYGVAARELHDSPIQNRGQQLSIQQTNHAPVHFDATQMRRERMRSLGRAHGAESFAAVQAHTNTEVHTFNATTGRKSHAAYSSLPSSSPLLPSEPVNNTLVQREVKVQLTAAMPKRVEALLVDFVVEQTGYPAEIIELDWDIEADLGIDSIKKAQLFGELREFFDLGSLKNFSLDHYRTLRDIANLLERTPGKYDWLETEPTVDNHKAAEAEHKYAELATKSNFSQTTSLADNSLSEPPLPLAFPNQTRGRGDVAKGYHPLDANQPSEVSAHLQLSSAQLQQFLIDFVVEQTGYPPDIVELDADLEADLGIDSIKKAQLFGELREMFGFSGRAEHVNGRAPGEIPVRQSLADYRTLRNVLDSLLQGQPDGIALVSTQINATAQVPVAQIDSLEGVAEVMAGANKVSMDIVGTRAGHHAWALNNDGVVNCDWPVAVVKQSAATVNFNAAYQHALEANLTAMVGRKLPHQPEASKNGNGAAYNRLNISPNILRFAEKIAVKAVTLEQSILALDKALLSSVNWQPGTTASLADCHAPRWLEDGGGEFAGLAITFADLDSSIMIGPAGCMQGTAVIHNLSLLVVGGILNAPQDAIPSVQCKLSQWILSTAQNNFETAVRSARSLKLNCDWWVRIVDAHSRQQALIESQDSALIIDRSDVPAHLQPNLAVHNGISIRLDESRVSFVLSLHRSTLRIPKSELRLDRSWLEGLFGEHCPAKESSASEALSNVNGHANKSIAARYVLQMTPSPLRRSSSKQPTWAGAALIVGDNAVARQLEARLRNIGLPVTRLAANEDPNWLAAQLEMLWSVNPIHHLFLTTPCDHDARITLDEADWKSRRNKGIFGNFWLCQRWLNRVLEAEMADDASLVAVTSQGGDFGISGNLYSAEGGALGGLLKSILIEAWMQGVRSLPIKIVDTQDSQSPADVVENVWNELAVPSYDAEVSYVHGVRRVLRAIPRPIGKTRSPIESGSTWVCTGGARGITAFVAEQLAVRYQLKLHLLGKSEEPSIDPSWRSLEEEGLKRLRAQIMTAAREAGKNPVLTWQDTEKAIEIDATLRRFAELGIQTHYHSCDVSNRESVRKILDKVRSISGPIHGVLHGAGVGKDARFDRKQADKVHQCIAAKVDGALSLMEATEHDPLKYFVGFGSISGRFGANGHTDYSLANEMLCKQIDWLKHRRPDVKAVGFHWHAWGDIGMATRPETRLALEMIDMQFMPAAEGIQHLISELEGDSNESEVLITDDRYYRMFYPAESVVTSATHCGDADRVKTPLLTAEPSQSSLTAKTLVANVDPGRDPFLTEHTLDGSPLLPFVIAAEMLIEGAAAHLATHEKLMLLDLQAVRSLKFFSALPRQLRVESKFMDEGSVSCQLQSDFYSRDGRLVEAQRVNFQALAMRCSEPLAQRVAIESPAGVKWLPVAYPAVDAQFYVGWPLQRLRKVTLIGDGLIGKISAPALIELAGTKRDLQGWRIPSAAMDASLFAAGILAWHCVAPGTALPIRIGRLEVGRLPNPGEACQVHVQLKSTGQDQAVFDFTLYGIDGEMILNARDYEVAWLARGAEEKLAANSLHKPR